MAIRKLISSTSPLRKSLHCLSLLTTHPSLFPSVNPTTLSSSTSSLSPFQFYPSSPSFRHFSHHPSSSSSTHELNSITESELTDLGFLDGAATAEIADVVGDSVLPIRVVVSLLDGYHNLTGLPWWIVIASSTLALRIMLFPWLVFQLQKLKAIAETMPKLPPPFPPPLSGRSFRKQFSLFQRERRALGCPSPLWFLGSFAVQLPCFILLMSSIRRMSLNHHPGFDTGGILWFQNLTELPNGVLGPILPILIGGLHFCNVKVSFRSSSVGREAGLFGLLAKYYRKYLELLTLPLLFTGFCIPQGSLVYWVTNSSLTLVQQLSLQHPTIRQKLGLANAEALHVAENPKSGIIESPPTDATGRKKLGSLSTQELVDLSIVYLAKGKKDRAISLLRLALDKDPQCFRALAVMGQAKLQEGLYEEAIEYLEDAISKISFLEQPIDGEKVDVLIQAHLSAGAAFLRQGKGAEASYHFERIKDMEEPEDRVAKARYYEGLVVLSSILYNEGREDEAAEYVRRAVAYDPEYAVFLKSLGINKDDFVGDLVSSRRGDY